MSDKKQQLQKFLDKLFSYKPDSTNFLYENPYLDELSIQRYNLEQYLTYMLECRPCIMLVGEAPGYRGCQRTGIPFVSGAELLNHNNDSLLGTWTRRTDQDNKKEASAQYVMDALRKRYDKDKMIPLIWNSFPYHPYKGENRNTNRPPTSEEIKIGKSFIEELKTIFDIQDENIYCVGRKAQKALGMEKDDHYIRHPSYGGKAECQDYLINKVDSQK